MIASFSSLLQICRALPTTFFLFLVTLLASSSSATAQGSDPPTGPPTGPPPDVTLEMFLGDTSVEISGATAGGEVALLTVWREAGGGGTEVSILDEALLDEDGDGVVTLEVESGYPELSVWIAVDLATGARIVLSPESFEPRRPGLRLGRFNSAPGQAELDLPRAEVLLIRPEAGAFRATLGDGGTDDQDGEVNGRVALTASELRRPVLGPPRTSEPELPSRFEPGDVVLAIDPRTLQVAEVEVPGKAPAEPAGGAS